MLNITIAGNRLLFGSHGAAARAGCDDYRPNALNSGGGDGIVQQSVKEAARRIIWRADRGTTADLRRRFVALDPVSVQGFRNHLLANWSTNAYWDS